IYSINRNTVEAGTKGQLGQDKEKSFAVIIPFASQHDPNEAIELVDKLMIAGVEVSRAKGAFEQDGVKYPAGTFVVPFNQVFARSAKDSLENQTSPEARRSPSAPAEAPYDVSAWSLGMQFGVNTVFAHTPLSESLALEKLSAKPKYVLRTAGAGNNTWRFPYNGALSAMVVNRLLKSGARVSLTKPENGISYVLTTAKPDVWTKATEGFELRNETSSAPKAPALATTLNKPRIAIYQSFDPSMDEG